MGSLLSSLFSRLTQLGKLNSERNFKIIIVGMNNAGKTTILYKLALNEVIITEPTIGSNVEEVTHGNVKLQLWDLGGQESLRNGWDAYYQNTDALIYVVDSADDSQLKDSKAEFLNLFVQQQLSEAVILLLANKQELPSARTPDELKHIFQLESLSNQDWSIQPCCALTGEGLPEALDWLTSRLSEKVSSSSGTQQKGLLLSKLDDNDRKANLNDLTIRTSHFENAPEDTNRIFDEEAGTYGQSIHKKDSGGL